MASALKHLTPGVHNAPPRIVVYGVQGIGKSTFAARSPDPVFICTEDGLGNIDTTSFPVADSFSAVMDQLGVLYQEKHSFKTLVIDSLDWLEPLIWASTCKKHNKETIEDFGYGKGYMMALDDWKLFLDGVNALRNDKGMAVVMLAHEQIRRFDSPEVEPYDRYEIKLHKSASALIQEWADATLFANYKTMISKADVGFNKKVNRGTGTGERLLHTNEMPAYRAKNRYGLPQTLPFSWDAFVAAMSGDNAKDVVNG